MKIERPGAALWIYFGIGFLLYSFGIRDGTLVVVSVVCGVFFYRLLLTWR